MRNYATLFTCQKCVVVPQINHLGYFWIKSKLTYLHCPTVVHNVDGFLCLHFAFKRQKGTT